MDGEFPPVTDVWYLTGATASGKTRIGVELARLLNAEILSLDSMAVFRGMDIGTAKPSAADRQATPHHLLDLVEPDGDFSLAQYLAAAHTTIADVRRRGREVLFVGGTPLYLKSLLRGLCQGPPADWEFRSQIEAEIQEAGLASLHRRLELLDPLAAAKLHPNDKRRIIRALEVIHLTGLPLSHSQTQFDELPPQPARRLFVLNWPRAVLHDRIGERVDQMFADGLVEEVRGLITRHAALSRTALQAVGYREVIEHLRGERDLPATIELVKARTRQFARRQETWFRSLAECRPIAMTPNRSASDVAEEISKVGNAT